MSKVAHRPRPFRGRDQGATVVEYGLMVALVLVVALVAFVALGSNVPAALDALFTRP